MTKLKAVCVCVCTYIKWGRVKVKFNSMGMGELDNATELQGSWRYLVLLDVPLLPNLNCKHWDAM